MTISELKQKIITNVQRTEDSQILIKVYNTLVPLNKDYIKKILAPHYTVPETLDYVTKLIIQNPPPVENNIFLKILQAISTEGVIPILADGKRINFLEAAKSNIIKLTEKLEDVSTEDTLLVLNFLVKTLLNQTFVQRGVAGGAGELLFALLLKGGSKREIGDLDLQGKHVEIKGSYARLVGESDQGGFNGKPSQHGARLKKLIMEYARGPVPSIDVPAALNITLKGPTALQEALPHITNRKEFAVKYANLLTDVVLKKPPSVELFKQQIAQAIETENWPGLHKAYAMYHYAAYQYAAGWDILLQFDSKTYQMLPTSTPETFYNAFEQGLSYISSFSFSPGTKGEGSESRVGFKIKVLAPGESPVEREEQRTAQRTAKELAKYKTRLDKINKAIADQETKLATITAPSRRVKIFAMLNKYKSASAELVQKIEELKQ